MRQIIRTSMEPSKEDLRAYWVNWWAKAHRRKAPVPDVVGACTKCGAGGVLGYELTYRGATLTNNLTCDKCFRSGGKRRAISSGASQDTPKRDRKGPRRIARRGQ